MRREQLTSRLPSSSRYPADSRLLKLLLSAIPVGPLPTTAASTCPPPNLTPSSHPTPAEPRHTPPRLQPRTCGTRACARRPS